MNQTRKLFPSNGQVKPQVVSQAPSIQANTFLKGHRKEDASSFFFIDFNKDNLHHWGNNLTLLCCFSIPFSRADKVTWQETSVALHTMMGNCLGMTGKRVNACLPGREQEKGDKYSSAECTFLVLCEALEGCRRGQVGSGGQLALQLSVQLHRAQPRPSAGL